MPRTVTVGAAQLGPIARDDCRTQVVERMIALLRRAHARGCQLVVYPELALTTFFPRWYMENQQEVDAFFEREMPGPDTQPLFDEARRLGVGFHLGYAELMEEDGHMRRFNTCILVDGAGAAIGKYRKIHLPGHAEHEPERPFQHLEKRYFEVGNLGFRVFEGFGGKIGLCICNDRRWSETYRVMGLQGAEMILLGYNTPRYFAPSPTLNRLADFHSHLAMQSGAYQNGAWVVGVAKAGVEEGCELCGQSCIISPTGEIVAMAVGMGDELIAFDCDLDLAQELKTRRWNFGGNREPEHYRLITERRAEGPPLGSQGEKPDAA